MGTTAEIETTTSEELTVPAIFLSRRRDLVLVATPDREALDALHRPYIVPGTRFEFHNGRFETTDPDTIEWLRRHPRNGDMSEGFSEVEPQAPVPEGELLDLATAGATGDVEKIRAIVATEESTWKREIVLRTAEATLDAIEDAKGGQAEADIRRAEDHQAREAAEQRAADAEARAAAAEQQIANLQAAAQVPQEMREEPPAETPAAPRRTRAADKVKPSGEAA
jgi:hypothetical protein